MNNKVSKMSNNIFLTYIIGLLPKYIIRISKRDFFYVLIISSYLLQLSEILLYHHNTKFSLLSDIIAVDYLDNDNRFQLLYNIMSSTYCNRIFFKCNVNELSFVNSLVTIYPNSNWYERECWDLYGVYFLNNPDLRRILTDYGFLGHPFRKDFPLSGFYESVYSECDKRMVYRPISHIQEFRLFSTTSPWNKTYFN